MDFVERQETARRSSRLLILFFLLAVIGIVLSVYAAATFVFAQQDRRPEEPVEFWRPDLFLWVAASTTGVILIGSLTKFAELSRGGSVIAANLGGRIVQGTTSDPDERKLLNVVEEMSIAAGMAVPQVYVMDAEDGINAFAAGFGTDDAVVGVTRGAITQLTRDELQGVIAHEFSHILNGDMRLNLRLIGMVHGILCLALLGRILLRSGHLSSGRGKKGGNPLPFLGLALLAIGGIGVFFGRLIKSAVSRQREYLADAAAVQFTRNPIGLAGALKKIGGLAQGSRLQSEQAEEASHLFFSNGLQASFLQMFATHPPLEERIRLLDPTFAGQFEKVTKHARIEPVVRRVVPSNPRQAAVSSLATSSDVVVSGSQLSSIGGDLQPIHLANAASLIASLPEEIARATTTPLDAVTLVCALLLDASADVRDAQMDVLAQTDAALANRVHAMAASVGALDASQRLPVIDLCLPALGQLSRPQFETFRALLKLMVEADAHVELFEFALQQVVLRHLQPQFSRVRKPGSRYYVLKPAIPSTRVLLSLLAHAGHSNAPDAERAFLEGARLLQVRDPMFRLLPIETCSLGQLETALELIGEAAPEVKKQIMDATAATAATDGVLHFREAELLRAFADALGCPIPLPGAQSEAML